MNIRVASVFGLGGRTKYLRGMRTLTVVFFLKDPGFTQKEDIGVKRSRSRLVDISGHSIQYKGLRRTLAVGRPRHPRGHSQGPVRRDEG